MRKLIAACSLSMVLAGCGTVEPPIASIPITATPGTTDPHRPVVCTTNTSLSDPIDLSINVPISTEFFLLSTKIPATETVHKLCTLVRVTAPATKESVTAHVEMILQRTPAGTQLVQLTSESFFGDAALANVGVGGQTLLDGTFQFLAFPNSVRQTTTWSVRGWRQRIP